VLLGRGDERLVDVGRAGRKLDPRDVVVVDTKEGR